MHNLAAKNQRTEKKAFLFFPFFYSIFFFSRTMLVWIRVAHDVTNVNVSFPGYTLMRFYSNLFMTYRP